MRTINATTLWVCTDCTLTHHGYDSHELGYTPEFTPWSLWTTEEITAGRECAIPDHYDDGTDSHSSDCESVEFSWQPCDGCASPLAGTRHAFTAWSE